MSEPNPTLPPLTEQDILRFYSNVPKGQPDKCWEWQGTSGKRGYGVLKICNATIKLRQMVKAHRLAYFLHYGIEPGHLCVCHACDNPPCCNPSHLFLGTFTENITDMINKGRNAKGEQTTQNTPKNAQVIEIRARDAGRAIIRGARIALWRVMAAEYGVCEGTIQQIVYHKKWKHL